MFTKQLAPVVVAWRQRKSLIKMACTHERLWILRNEFPNENSIEFFRSYSSPFSIVNRNNIGFHHKSGERIQKEKHIYYLAYFYDTMMETWKHLSIYRFYFLLPLRRESVEVRFITQTCLFFRWNILYPSNLLKCLAWQLDTISKWIYWLQSKVFNYYSLKKLIAF